MTPTTEIAANIHAHILASAGFGRFTGRQLSAMGLTGADLIALLDAGLAHFDRMVEGSERPDGRCECWYIIHA